MGSGTLDAEPQSSRSPQHHNRPFLASERCETPATATQSAYQHRNRRRSKQPSTLIVVHTSNRGFKARCLRGDRRNAGALASERCETKIPFCPHATPSATCESRKMLSLACQSLLDWCFDVQHVCLVWGCPLRKGLGVAPGRRGSRVACRLQTRIGQLQQRKHFLPCLCTQLIVQSCCWRVNW